MNTFKNIYSLALYGYLAYLIFNMIPSSLDPVVWSSPFPLPTFNGTLTPNTFLASTAKHGLNVITAPESMAIEPTTGYVFASLNDGRVVLIDEKGNYQTDVFFNGMIALDFKQDESMLTKLEFCTMRAQAGELAWHVEEEKSCGRPLGLRLVQKVVSETEPVTVLYILDAYNGLYALTFDKVLSKPLSITHHFNPTSSISTPSPIDPTDPIATLPPKFFNDLDIMPDGRIFYTDTSYRYHRSQNRQEVLDGAPRGRFFVYDPSTNIITVLACGLHFPNGVQVHDPASVLVVESTRFRVLKMNINSLYESNMLLQSCAENGSLSQTLNDSSSINAGVGVFLENGPGFMDNIRRLPISSNAYLYLIGVGTKASQPFSLLHFAYQGKMLRHIIGRIIPMRFVEKLLPAYGLVIVVGTNGEILSSFHDPSGSMSFISEAQFNPFTGELWMGSHSNKFIGILTMKNLK